MDREARPGEDDLEGLRPLLFSIAYRMVGSVSEAEDLVQEAYLRFHRSGGEGVASPRAYLSTTVTRLAIDHLRSARVRRERYVGPWLPEPLVTESEPDPAEHAETADSLSMAFLVLLETLSPVERAVFLLREVFGFGYGEIAPVVGKSEEACRQIASRARRRVEAGKPRFDATREQRRELGERFFRAAWAGDIEALIELLAADAVAIGDGGGKAPALARPLHGRERVARVLVGWARQANSMGIRIRPAEVNGQPGAVAFDDRGRIVTVMALDISEGLVQTVRSIVNPEKLGHLGPVGDLGRLLRDRGRTTGPATP
ncbi:MAG TPA: RNA polymerase sigma-70 factor [Actinomycetota bacterium]|nr:RNA polymerase sigma-70 factor [Actinomycetota bacterium]